MWILSVSIALFVVVLFALYLKTVAINNYWSKKGIPHIKSWPIIGTMSDIVFKKVPMSKLLGQFYKNSDSCLGIHYFTTPCIILKDLDLIKQITIKEFQSFPAHSTVVSESADPLISKTLLFMKGDEKWRRLRSTISPAFTSSKIKTMFKLMTRCASELITYIEECNGALEMKGLFSKYATDVIGNCAVGVSCNSFKNPNNHFLRLARDTSNSFKSIKTYVHAIHPTLAHILNLRLINKKYTDYWLKFSKDIIKTRESGVYRPDMIQLLLSVKNDQLTNTNNEPESSLEQNLYQSEETSESNYHLTDEDIAAQTLLFLLAGYDTSSTASTFAAYELATNLNVQTKLQEEIDAMLEKCAGNPVTYEDLLEMKYLDAVVSETLRKWPPVTYVDRKCYKECMIEFKGHDSKPVKFDRGVLILIPIHAIHRDPKYYPDPEIFDPERFYGQNKSNIKPFTFMPFGVGPKSCMGSRFALLEVKILLFYVLAKFDITPVKETPNPMPLKGKFLLEAETCWLSFTLRKHVK